ncbi:MAG TPA: hypothetical protein VNV66_21190, partial [Pilimelia sp.]|nr:hypothetical protein [Pilimelia sp.]
AAAREELAAVAARLAPQRARLREAGVPDERLAPTPDELAAANHAAGNSPAAVLAALRQARATADSADGVLLGGRFGGGRGAAPVWLRNLLVYGPFALTVLVVQLALYLVVSDAPLPVYAACGLAMPLLAFGLAWAVIGLVFPAGPDGRVDRTWPVGLLVCCAPVTVMCLGTGVLALLR